MATKKLSPAQVQSFHKEGYVVVKNYCSKEETDKLYRAATEDSAMSKNILDVSDQSGKKSKLSLWFKPANDVFGYLTRSERMVNSVAQLLDSDAPVCHFHSKCRLIGTGRFSEEENDPALKETGWEKEVSVK